MTTLLLNGEPDSGATLSRPGVQAEWLRFAIGGLITGLMAWYGAARATEARMNDIETRQKVMESQFSDFREQTTIDRDRAETSRTEVRGEIRAMSRKLDSVLGIRGVRE